MSSVLQFASVPTVSWKHNERHSSELIPRYWSFRNYSSGRRKSHDKANSCFNMVLQYVHI